MLGHPVERRDGILGRIGLIGIDREMHIITNLFADRGDTRLDLTGEQLYTLSSGTRRTLARIDEPITLRFYY